MSETSAWRDAPRDRPNRVGLERIRLSGAPFRPKNWVLEHTYLPKNRFASFFLRRSGLGTSLTSCEHAWGLDRHERDACMESAFPPFGTDFLT